ncbi:MAG: hypothetical protein ABI480_05835 [Chitinophagaceae bacterium]
MKIISTILALIWSLTVSSQDSLKARAIDSLIEQNEKLVARVIYDKIAPVLVRAVHGRQDTVLFIYKYSPYDELIEYSKAWIEKDTGQISAHYFYKDKLIKITTRVAGDYVQVAYFEKGHAIPTGDPDGKRNNDMTMYLKKCPRILKSAKAKLKN